MKWPFAPQPVLDGVESSAKCSLESVLLSLAGGGIGLLLGTISIHALLYVNPGNIPRIGEHGSAVAMDGRIFAFTICISLLTGILFGLTPAFRGSHTDLSTALKQSGGRSAIRFRHDKAPSMLVSTELALAMVLLIGSGPANSYFCCLAFSKDGFRDRERLEA